MAEIQVTKQPGGHVLTNIGVWSPDGQWIVYDTRSDPAGEKFDGHTIEIVHVDSGEIRQVYRSQNGAHCGVATFHATADKVVFILGPEHPTPDWQYGISHRQGVVVDLNSPGKAIPLDARDLSPPFTPGALRGGTHVHIYSSDGQLVSFTYDDNLIADHARNIGVSAVGRNVTVPKTRPRNHDGSAFSVLVTRTTKTPRPGSDEISRAFEEAWVGTNGYLRPDGTRQHRALAFQGHVKTATGNTISEAFLVDLPDDLTQPGDAPLAGTQTTPPAPPRGTTQRRLTHTSERKFPGLQGPRHWLRSSPNGEQIALLMRDDAGIIQLWTITPLGGEPKQITSHPFDVASAFSWSPDGSSIAYVADRSVFVTRVDTGESERLTEKKAHQNPPRPEACVFAPDGSRIAYVRPVEQDGANLEPDFRRHAARRRTWGAVAESP